MQNRSIKNVPWYPQTGEGQAIAYTDLVVGLSAALTVGKEHNIWVTEHAWVRVGGGAAANDFPIAAGAIYVYTPQAAGLWGDDQLSFLGIAAATAGVAYIGQSEE